MQHAPWLALNAAIAVLCLRVHPTLFVLVVAATAMVCATHTPPGSGMTSSAASSVSARATTTDAADADATNADADTDAADANATNADATNADGDAAADRVPNPRKTASEDSKAVRAPFPTEFGYADETPEIRKAWNGQVGTTPPWSKAQHDSYMAARAQELREFHQNGLGRWGDDHTS